MFRSVRPMIVLAGAFVIAGASLSSAQPIAAGGKNTQALFENVPFDANGEATVTMTIPYGRKHRILLVNAFTRGIPGAQECDMSLVMTAGPDTSESFGGSVTGRQGGSYTATGHWWMDIDANEAATPGQYVGKPIPVELVVHKGAGDPCTMAHVSLNVQMVKY